VDYRAAGVDIAAGDRVVAGIKERLGKDGRRIGHFGGAFPLDASRYRKPVLVSSIDGVGTKISVALAMGELEGVGCDLVHHSINDLAVCGAEPLFFLDYIAMGRLDSDAALAAVGGIVKACKEWDVALVGGETAEMPGVYRESEIDLVGTIVGIMDEADRIDGETIVEGDVLIGFPSSGLHTNGFSLARRVLSDAGIGYDRYVSELGSTVGAALLAGHRCYLKEIRALRSAYRVKGLAHITGGGLEGNTHRIIPHGLQAVFSWGEWPVPPIFGYLKRTGSLTDDAVRPAFNMGIGLLAALSPPDARQALASGEWTFAPMQVGVVKAI